MGKDHKYLERFWKNGKWNYVYKKPEQTLIPKNQLSNFMAEKANMLKKSKENLKNLRPGLKVVYKGQGKNIFGKKVTKTMVDDRLKFKDSELLRKVNRLTAPNKKIGNFLSKLGIAFNKKAYKSAKADRALETQERRWKSQNEYHKNMKAKDEAKKRKQLADTNAESANKKGRSQTAYQKKMYAYHLKQESKKAAKRIAEEQKRNKAELAIAKVAAKRKEQEQRTFNYIKNLKAYDKKVSQNNAGLKKYGMTTSDIEKQNYYYKPAKKKAKKKSSGNSWKKNLGLK